MPSGQYAQVSCLAFEGDLPITIEWSLNGQPLNNYAEISIDKVGKRSSILTIESTSHPLAGNYSCRAINRAGTAEYVTQLQINGYCFIYLDVFTLFPPVLPRISPFTFEESPVQAGSYTSVQCSAAEGDLPITFEWSLNGKIVDNYPEITIDKVGKRSSILTIESASYNLSGNYSCKANNKAGSSEYIAQLYINGECFNKFGTFSL